MRHRAPRPLLDVRLLHRGPGTAARRRPLAVLAAGAVGLFLAVGGALAISTVSDDPDAPHAGSTASVPTASEPSPQQSTAPDDDRTSVSRSGRRTEGSATPEPTASPPSSTPSTSPDSGLTGLVELPTASPSPLGTEGPSRTRVPSPTPSESDTAEADDEDTDPPETTLVDKIWDLDVAELGFVADEPATFSCRLDDGAWTSCGSPARYADLAPGWHTFAVRATDLAGNVDPSPAEARWLATARPGSGG
jgi:hypothetical protein